jgi:uncharacterized protein YfiM (DUF2279 family)
MTTRNIFTTLTITFTCALGASSQKIHHVVGSDKVKHVVIGSLFTSAAQALAYKLTDNRGKSMLFGLGTGIAAGVVKELYDMTGRGTPSVTDFLWTAAGAGVASVSLRYALTTKPNISKGL